MNDKPNIIFIGSRFLIILVLGGVRTYLTLAAAAGGIVWLIALCGGSRWIPRGTVLADWQNTRTDRAVVYNWTAVAHWTR